jgi:hypothetical protein
MNLLTRDLVNERSFGRCRAHGDQFAYCRGGFIV